MIANAEAIPTSTRQKQHLQTLPLELIFHIKEFLETSDQALLGLTCKNFSLICHDSWNQLRSDPEQRLSFLVQLDRTLPDSRFCSGCSKYHARSFTEEQQAWLTAERETKCGELNVPLVEDLYIHWPRLYLALRKCNYGTSRYGCSLGTLPRNLPDTYDAIEGLTWHHSLSWWIDHGRFMIAACSHREWYGESQTLSQHVRGYHITVESHDSGLQLCVRRIIDAAATRCWGNIDRPGWAPSKDKTWRWYHESTGCYDPDAGLPGLHWTELSARRKAQGVPEWSAWRWCSKTGLPYNVKDVEREERTLRKLI